MFPLSDNQAGMPLVSVVLLTFDRPHLLRGAIACVLAQTYTHLEILICNNASDQETSDVINQFHDSRIHHHRHETNIGMTGNVRWGFLAAKGKYVANLHDDDLWEPTFIEKMVAVLEEHPEAVISFSDHTIIDAEGRIDEKITKENTKLFARSNLASGIYKPFKKLALVDLAIPICLATVFRRAVINWDDFDNLPSVYDFWLAYITSRDGGACYYVDEKLASYRHHANSESTRKRVRVNDAYIQIYAKMLQDERLKEFYGKFIPRYADHYRDAAVSLLRSGDRTQAREYLQKGLKIHSNLKARLTYWATFLPENITKHFPVRVRF